MTERRRAFRQSGRTGQSGQPGRSGQDDNPFAPPPEGSPDRPWRPRTPASGGPGGDDDRRGDDRDQGGRDDDGSRDQGGDDSARRKWGSQWSSRQPGRQGGGFGGSGGPGETGSGGDGPRDTGPRSGGPRWDPRDPVQRHARYAAVSGTWGLLLSVFQLLPLGLLFGALAVYWGVSALRGAPGAKRPEDAPRTATADLTGARGTGGASGDRGAVARTAVPGLVTGALAILVVAGAYTFQLVNHDYYACVDDALTTVSREECKELLPEPFRDNALFDTDR
ncbi:hypothetical protein GCM10023347_08810 [Streptomyces chumphonensis]|uniref:Integral membrane protein n=1 Tax=Streptomyces chumphonensis TaxID=1214925 RepID=A0A927EZ89_9ACTN|nr:hypothetical protein [Streptomyces chumphonensis]MBD3932351.1 hypothetical protein [Streptomyces chumphonensis]